MDDKMTPGEFRAIQNSISYHANRLNMNISENKKASSRLRIENLNNCLLNRHHWITAMHPITHSEYQVCLHCPVSNKEKIISPNINNN